MDFLKKTWRDIREQWRMYRELYKDARPDCRGALLGELIFNPDALRRRYNAERVFESRLARRWQGVEDDDE